LFGPVFEILRTGQDASLPKHLVNVMGEPLVEILAKRDHRCPLLKAVLGVFPLKNRRRTTIESATLGRKCL